MDSEPQIITQASQLPTEDGTELTLRGVYTLIDPLPKLQREVIDWRVGILLEDEERPSVFLELPRPEGEMDEFMGEKIDVTGIFHPEQPRREGEPEHAVRMSGKWLYEVKVSLVQD